MTSVSSQISKLSHKCFRAMLKKFRRKKKRQLLAKAREEEELIEQKKRESLPHYRIEEEEKRRNRELWVQFEERESIRKNKLWMLTEEKAQMEFKRKMNLLELEKVRQEEERKRILAEFEDRQILENVALEADRKVKLQKEEALQAALSGLPEGGGPWHNPIVPPNFYEVKERDICHFFSKTGCCKFGDSCSRGHVYPSVSCTILIRGMYSHFSIGQRGRDEFDLDIALEYEDKERYQDFKNFYNDVLPEFKKFGQVVQFKVCQNHEPHLRGNVYIQFSNEDEALEAYKSFNGRFYGGKQLTCDFTHVNKWKAAICGMFKFNECPKGIYCNFLHVFKNPRNEFWEADSDFLAYQETFIPSGRSQREKSSRSNNHRQVKVTYKYRRASEQYYPDGNNDADRSNTRNSASRSSESCRRRANNGYYYRYRDSRSRSPLSSHSSDELEKRSSHKKKKKHKKKSKKSKKSKRERKHSSESEEKV